MAAAAPGQLVALALPEPSRAGDKPSRSLKFYTTLHFLLVEMLKAATTAVTLKNLLRHYNKQALTHSKKM